MPASHPEHIVSIDAAAHGGHGVARIDGQVCFVAHALPGDTVRIALERAAKGVLWARIAELIEPSPHRETPPCEVFGACGGCSWLHFAYDAQLASKRRIVQDCLQRIARIDIAPDIAANPALRRGYRTRAELHGDGESWGFYARGSRDVVDIASCPLCHPRLNAALAQLRTVRAQTGVEITVNPEGDDVLVWVREPSRPGRTRAGRRPRRAPRDAARRLVRNAFPQAQGLGDDAPRAAFSFDGVPVVNGAFSQGSLLLNRLLRDVVGAMLGDARNVLDLYCGSGNLSLRLADEGRRVLGLDHNGAAVAAAAATGKGTYEAGSESDFAEALADATWDAVILDPPRQGAKAIAPALAAAPAHRVVYVSCDPATLARDARALIAEGWRPAACTVIDLFPDTPHVETAIRFDRA